MRRRSGSTSSPSARAARALGTLLGAFVLAGCAASELRPATAPRPPADVARPSRLEAPPAPVVVTAPFAPDSGTLALRCARVFDGESAEVLRDAVVLIRAGRIVAVGADVAVPADVPRLELPEHTCLPGLVDLHTHLTDRPENASDFRVFLKRSADEQLRQSRENAIATLHAGFTSVRDVGTYVAWLDRELRDEIAAGRTLGPRMQVAGYYLTIPGGGGDMIVPGTAPGDVPTRLRAGVARGPEQFRAKAQAAVDGGADVLKVIASGAVLAFGGVPAAPEMRPDEIAAVVEVAHASGLKVAAHAHGARSIVEAIRAGADTIEHASLLDDAGIALARERGTVLVMDVYNGDWIDVEGRRLRWPDEFLRKNLETTEAQRQAFTRAHAAGVAIAYGTDAAVYPHGLNARQLRIMVERGMTPAEALRAATSVAARALGWNDRVGRLAPGLYGDVIAVRGDPLADVTRLEAVDVVVRGGLLVKR